MISMTQMKLYFHLFSIGSVLLFISIIMLFHHYYMFVDLSPETSNLYIIGIKPIVEPYEPFVITSFWIHFSALGICCIIVSMFFEDFLFYMENIRPLKKMFK